MRVNQLSVLITGGSGLVGRYLTSLLLSKGYKVSHLSRSGKSQNQINVFKWDTEIGMIDEEALTGVNFVVHLAGANIGEKRWTDSRKKEILSSRVQSAELLFNKFRENRGEIKAFISASAVGYYGSGTSDKIYTESDLSGNDFLGSVCKSWEEAADRFEGLGIRTVKIRTGVVLEKTDSALSKLMMTGKFGFLVKTGNGNQYMPWIHIGDLCNIYLKAIEDNSMSGAYNVVSPQHITHNEFMETLGKVMKRKVLPVSIPAFLLKTVLGEMSDVVLKGSRVSSEKIGKTGFAFNYPELKMALLVEFQ
jgi:uncharacterized protein (TIGR01777 family)